MQYIIDTRTSIMSSYKFIHYTDLKLFIKVIYLDICIDCIHAQ